MSIGEPGQLRAVAKLGTGFSNWHITSAALFAGQCASTEAGNAWPPKNSVLRPHMAFAFGSVISSVCALEAYLDELRRAAVDRAGAPILGKIEPVSRQVEELWGSLERQSLFVKFGALLSLAGVDRLDKGSSTMQRADNLLKLRGALVHAKAEWDDNPEQSAKIESRLRGKFPENALAPPSQEFFPYRCMGAGSSRWAVETAIAFVDEFSAAIGARSRWDKIRTQLHALMNGETIPDP